MTADRIAPYQPSTGQPGWGGVYYPGDTIKFGGYQSSATPLAIGATSWEVYDDDGVAAGVIASGTCLSTDTTITVAPSGVWASGGTPGPMRYTLVTNNGLTGYFCMCPNNPAGGASALYNPHALLSWPNNTSNGLPGNPESDIYWGPWASSGGDRNSYNYPSWTPAQLVGYLATDPYYTFAQDSARPHSVKFSTGEQTFTAPSTWGPPATGTGSWQALATYAAANGAAGAWYEGPTNEFQNAGATWTQVATGFTAMRNAIRAADPTAKVMGPCSAGLTNGGGPAYFAEMAVFFAALPHGGPGDIDGWSEHTEDTFANPGGDIVIANQYMDGMQAVFTAAGVPNLTVWFTENGVTGGGYDCYAARREARQRLLLRMIAEQHKWPKEQIYDFTFNDDNVYSTFCAEATQFALQLRSGIYCVHVAGEALFGMPVSSVTNLITGSVSKNFFAASHYHGSARDVVWLMSNNVNETDTYILQLSGYSSGASVTYWDAYGRASTATVNSSGQITVPIDDLAAYVFLTSGTTVTFVDSGSGIIACDTATNIASSSSGASMVNQASTAMTIPNNGSFAETAAGITSGHPYLDLTMPASLTISNLLGTGAAVNIARFTFKGSFPWKNTPQLGASPSEPYMTAPLAMKVQGLIGGVWTDLWTYNSETAISYPIATPNPAGFNSNDACSRTTWWKGAFCFVGKLTPTAPVTQVRLNVTATSYGGEPDSAASALFEENVQALVVTEFQVYEATGTPPDTVTAISPTTGSAAGGTSVTITGTNLTPVQLGIVGASSPALTDFQNFNALIAPRSIDLILLMQDLNDEPVFYSSYSSWPATLNAEFMSTMSPGSTTLGAFTAGTYDTSGLYDGAGLVGLAEQCAAYGKPIIIRLAHEFNLVSGTYGYTSETALSFVNAWKHIVNLFRANGATNVKWCWCANIYGLPGATAVDPTAVDSSGVNWYPGDPWVDYIALDGYQTLENASAYTPDQLFMANYTALVGLSSRPFAISEFGCAEDTRLASIGGKAGWYDLFFQMVQTQMPNCVFVNQWQRVVESDDYTISSSSSDSAAAAAFASKVNSYPMVPSVSFGSIAATGVVVTSSTSITAISPAQSAGTVDVTVKTMAAGTSLTGSPDRFTYGTPGIKGTDGTGLQLVRLGLG